MHFFSERQLMAGPYSAVTPTPFFKFGKPMLLDATPYWKDERSTHIDLHLDCVVTLKAGVVNSWPVPTWEITPCLDGGNLTRVINIDAQQGCQISLPCRKAVVRPIIDYRGTVTGGTNDPDYEFIVVGSIGDNFFGMRQALHQETLVYRVTVPALDAVLFPLFEYYKRFTWFANVTVTAAQHDFDIIANDQVTVIASETIATRDVVIPNGCCFARFNNDSAAAVAYTVIFFKNI